jgi:GH24 family phage-related lysozyme (muramidase)
VQNFLRKPEQLEGTPKMTEKAQTNLPSTLTMSPAGLLITKYCEGLYLDSYQDSRGVWTIGYGRIKHDDGSPVKAYEKCTPEEAEKWLLADLEKDGMHYVRAWMKTTPLTQNEFDALSDFCFNRGAGNFKHLLSMPGVLADNFLTAVPGDHELGLQRRRRMNRAWFLGQDWEQYKTWRPS